MAQENAFLSVLESAAKLPLVRIDRVEFLTANLSGRCTRERLRAAIAGGTLRAGIPVETLDEVADAVIGEETLKVTAISTAAGIPGGLAMVATVSADLAQFYGFVLRVAQELAYLYGWSDLFADGSGLGADTRSELIVFVGVMSGVGAANAAVAKLFGETAMRAVAKRVAAKALTKTWYYPLVKRIAAMLGQKMVKATFAKGVSKVVPVLGGVISGGLTLATFNPMAHRLKAHLSAMARMTPDEFSAYEDAVVREAALAEAAAARTGADAAWDCACGETCFDNFCPACGSPRPALRPDCCPNCGWRMDDPSSPPNFCPSCGAALRPAD